VSAPLDAYRTEGEAGEGDGGRVAAAAHRKHVVYMDWSLAVAPSAVETKAAAVHPSCHAGHTPQPARTRGWREQEMFCAWPQAGELADTYERAKKLDACMMMQFPALQLPDSGLVSNMEEYVQHMLTPTGPAPPASTPAPVRAPAAAAPPAPPAAAADPFMQVSVPPVERQLGFCPPLWGLCSQFESH
jgi:hypothetical protein